MGKTELLRLHKEEDEREYAKEEVVIYKITDEHKKTTKIVGKCKCDWDTIMNTIKNKCCDGDWGNIWKKDSCAGTCLVFASDADSPLPGIRLQYNDELKGRLVYVCKAHLSGDVACSYPETCVFSDDGKTILL